MVDGIVHPGNRNTMVVLLKASLWGGAKLPKWRGSYEVRLHVPDRFTPTATPNRLDVQYRMYLVADTHATNSTNTANSTNSTNTDVSMK